jgi:diacylglycerol kinase family enzyme
MYAYVFDSFIQATKHRTEINRIEARLATLGIQGRQEKITILKNIQEAARGLLKRGADTLVAVGNDQTVAKILPLLVESEAALGIIPVGPDQRIAAALGIPTGTGACDMLSRRIMRRIDLGRVGSANFILDAVLPSTCQVNCDHKYTVESLIPGARLAVVNIGWPDVRSRPDDGRLELVVEGSTESGWFGHAKNDRSVFTVRQAAIGKTSDGQVILDGQVVVKTPLTIDVQRQKLHVIVGRDRMFE